MMLYPFSSASSKKIDLSIVSSIVQYLCIVPKLSQPEVLGLDQILLTTQSPQSISFSNCLLCFLLSPAVSFRLLPSSTNLPIHSNQFKSHSFFLIFPSPSISFRLLPSPSVLFRHFPSPFATLRASRSILAPFPILLYSQLSFVLVSLLAMQRCFFPFLYFMPAPKPKKTLLTLSLNRYVFCFQCSNYLCLILPSSSPTFCSSRSAFSFIFLPYSKVSQQMLFLPRFPDFECSIS